MQSAEIARRYLAHFEARGHAIVPSASLVADDPTLLFVVAGMQPFKPYLLGQQVPPWKRVADVQKCVRTLDIEEVGKTTRHATFFQMLGNWSFGDYFKEDAIRWAWELLTKSQADGGFGFPEERLWATVLHGDDESYAIWRDKIGVPESRIQRRGLKDNYWHMGVPGPGGPCSEIYFDKGPEHGREGGPEADEDRYLEVWNLVFMQDMLSAGPGQGRLRRRGRRCRSRTSTPAWAWSGWRPSCRASTTSTRSTPPTRSSTGRPSSPSRTTAPTRAATSRCGSSPTTCAARSC